MNRVFKEGILRPMGEPVVFSLSLSVASVTAVRQGLSLLPVPTAANDNFATNAGQLPGREMSGTGLAWALERATDTTSAHDTRLTVTTTGDGTAGGDGTSGAGNTYAVVTAPSQNVLVVCKRGTAFDAQHGYHVDHITAAGGVIANLTRFSFQSAEVTSGSISSGRVTFSGEQAGGTLTSIRQTSNLRFEVGDIFAREYTSDGNLMQILHNGRKRDDALDTSVATRGVPLSRKFGMSGWSPTTNVDYFAVIDPATDAAIVMGQCPSVASVHSDGTATILISGRYSIRAPETLRYTLYDRSSGSRVAVTGHTAETVAITSTALSGSWGTFAGTITLTEPQATALMGDALELMVERTDVEDQDGNPTTFPAWTQRFYLGTVALFDGQSLSKHASVQTISGTATPATGSRWIEASRTLNIEDRYSLPVSANTLPAHLSARLNTLSGIPVAVISAGESSTSTTERLPGTAIHTATLDGFDHAGGRVDVICDASGQNDASAPSTYYDNMVTIKAAYDAKNRGAAPSLIVAQMNKSWTNSDTLYQALREQQARLVENGVADLLGPNALDLRNQDDLHLGQASTDPVGSNAKWMQRWAQAIAYVRGDAAYDGQGPELAAVERTNDTTITAYFDDAEYFDAFDIVGESGAGYHGGCRFSASTDASSPVWPTGCTVGARVSGGANDGRWPVTFTFGSTLPATVYVWAGWGANPHNPLQDATINSTDWDDATNGASILQATKTGAPAGLDKVGIRPRLRYATPSYLVAS